MTRVTRRVARRQHRCESCRTVILPGEVHLEHVCSPNHDDLGNASWWRLRECSSCAESRGRAHLLAA